MTESLKGTCHVCGLEGIDLVPDARYPAWLRVANHLLEGVPGVVACEGSPAPRAFEKMREALKKDEHL